MFTFITLPSVEYIKRVDKYNRGKLKDYLAKGLVI